MSTPITRLLHVRMPIIAAPMAGASGGTLAAQVSLAGGFGFMAAGGHVTPQTLTISGLSSADLHLSIFFRALLYDSFLQGYEDTVAFWKELESARSILREDGNSPNESVDSVTRSDARDESLAIGVGFIGWTLDQTNGKAAELLSIALETRVAAVWFAFGADLGKWVRFVRTSDNNRSKPHKTIVFILVNSLQEAQTAVQEWDADVLVAQGIEAGGHGNGAAPPLLALVPEILSAFPADQCEKSCPPVIAAGGLSTGAHVAALLALGASGVALGTRFLLTPEARYTAAQKSALLAARGTSTVRTLAFDVMRGTTGWPAGIDGRALRNNTVERFENGEDLEDTRRLFHKASHEGDANGMLVWSGTGIGLINEIKPAADVVAELHDEMINRLRAATALITVAPEA